LVDSCDDGWSHSAVAVTADGDIVTYHPKDRALLYFSPDGDLLRTVPCAAREGHDLAIVDGGIWIADCGNKLSLSANRTPYVDPPEAEGQVLLVDADGASQRRIGCWHDGPFSPTGVTPDPRGRGIWIADGYGSHRIDLVAEDDSIVLTIDGVEEPHGITIDERGNEPLLYVTERRRARLNVYDLDGVFVRHEGEGHLVAPSSMVVRNRELWVADLVGRVTVLDEAGELVRHVGELDDRQEGWPNRAEDGRTVPPSLSQGTFNSPHGITTIGDDLVVTEWLLGGRWVRCSPAPPTA
jgi:hypothetical protein